MKRSRWPVLAQLSRMASHARRHASACARASRPLLGELWPDSIPGGWWAPRAPRVGRPRRRRRRHQARRGRAPGGSGPFAEHAFVVRTHRSYPAAVFQPELHARQDDPNLVTVPVGAGGKVSIYDPAGSVDVVGDVVGHFLDTTVPGGIPDHQPYSRSDPRHAQRHRRADAPARGRSSPDPARQRRGQIPRSGATAVVLNVTATNTTGSSFLTVWPSDVAQPLASKPELHTQRDDPQPGVRDGHRQHLQFCRLDRRCRRRGRQLHQLTYVAALTVVACG